MAKFFYLKAALLFCYLMQKENRLIFRFQDGIYRQYEYLNWMVINNYILYDICVTVFKNYPTTNAVFEIVLKRDSKEVIQTMEQILARTNWKILNKTIEGNDTFYYCDRLS